MRDSSKMKITFSSCDVTLSKLSLSCGTSGTGETIQYRKAMNGLTARPTESEQPGTDINFSHSKGRPKQKERDQKMKGLVKGLSYTVKNLTKQNVTTSYPDVPIQMPDRFRGIQKFYPEKCIVCNQCAQICPTDCIQLTGKPHPDPAKKGKIIDTYDINFEICILCDLCTEVCPTEAIVMTNQFELAEYSRDELFKNLEWLDENDENIRKENKA